MSLLMSLLFTFTSSMKALMESAFIPVPLFHVDFLIVSQMYPGMWCVWLGV